jgi:hypothetical protein
LPVHDVGIAPQGKLDATRSYTRTLKDDALRKLPLHTDGVLDGIRILELRIENSGYIGNRRCLDLCLGEIKPKSGVLTKDGTRKVLIS